MFTIFTNPVCIFIVIFSTLKYSTSPTYLRPNKLVTINHFIIFVDQPTAQIKMKLMHNSNILILNND